jgi:hypothetical protein
LQSKDLEALNFLTKQPSFSLKTKDLHNFTEQAITDKWHQGAKSLLSSLPAFLAYQGLEYQAQHHSIDSIITLVQDIQDLKLRRVFSLALVEDVLTKRPYSKVLALTLLNLTSDLRTQGQQWFDLAKLARECLKSLTGEDFRQLYISHREVMNEFEGFYIDINGNGVDNELAKIVMRYGKEGKPAEIVPDYS